MHSVKNSLSDYIVSNMVVSEKQLNELSEELDNILGSCKIVNEGIISKLKSLKENAKKGFLSTFLTSFGFAPSKYEQELEKIYKEKADKAKSRAKELKDKLEDAKVAKLRAKHNARETMLDEKNRAKVNDINKQIAKYESVSKYWSDRSKNKVAYDWSDNQLEDAVRAIDSLGLPPEDKSVAQQFLDKMREVSFKKQDGEWVATSAEERKKAIQNLKNSDPELYEQFKDYCDKNEINPETDPDFYGEDGAFNEMIDTSLGVGVDVKNAQEEVENLTNSIKDIDGDLTDEQKAAVKDYRKKKINEQRALIAVNDKGVDDGFLNTLSEDELKSMLPDVDLEKDGIISKEDGKISINIDKLKEKVKSTAEETETKKATEKLDKAIQAWETAANGGEGVEDAVAAVNKEAKKLGLPQIEEGQTLDDYKDVIKDKTKPDSDFVKDLLEKNASKAVTDPVEEPDVPTDQMKKYVECCQNPLSRDDQRSLERMKAERKKSQELVDKNSPEARQKRINAMMDHLESEKNSKKLFDISLDGTSADGKSFEEATKANNAGEHTDKDGKVYIEVDGEKKYAPKPGTEEFDKWDNERKAIVLGMQPDSDKSDVVIKDGKAIIIDKDGKEGEPIDLDSATKEEKDAIIAAKKTANQRVRNEREKEELVDKLKNGNLSDDITSKLSEETIDSLDIPDDKKEELKNNLKDTDYKYSSDDSDNENDSADNDADSEDYNSDLDDSDDKSDTDADRDENGKRINPAKVWHRKKKKNGTGSTKSYYNQKGESITKGEFKKKMESFKNYVQKHKKSKTESLSYYIKRTIFESRKSRGGR